ncbi:MAG: transcriptional repressor LexA [Deltaproteobacteria bacterium]|nr:transcriptional repressor LexA [Deltaproteobacteria bacterium]
MQKLTQRQEMVLNYIAVSINERGYPPTLREIGNHMGIRSTNGVNDHLRALERKGYLLREDMKSRALRPITTRKEGEDTQNESRTNNVVDIPIIGLVAAGQLAEAIEHPEDTVRVDRMLIGSTKDVFGLRVNGESMINAGIHNGDFVFVRKQVEAQRGEIVVALVGDEATCKYYFPENDCIRLEPANEQMNPIVIQKSDWRSTQILGVVVGLYRQLS